MKAISIFFLCLFVSSAFAQAQEIKKPVPLIDKTKGTNKFKDESKGQQTVTIELPSAINVTVGGQLEVKTENGPNLAEGLIAFFTGLLVLVTGWLVFYTKNLWGSTQTAADDARITAAQQAADTRNSLAIAKQSSDAAIKSSEASLESVALARKEFLTSHRPKIRVRRVALEEDRKTAEIAIRYDIVNIGTRPAHILGGIAQIMFWENPKKDGPLPPLTDPLDTAHYNVQGTIIEPGARNSRIVKASEEVGVNFQFGRTSDSSGNLYFLGFIKYRDDLDTIRETSFCRRLEKAGFFKVDHPDYEYED